MRIRKRILSVTALLLSLICILLLFSCCGSTEPAIRAEDGDGNKVSFGMTKESVDSVLGEGIQASDSDLLRHYGIGSGWSVYFRQEKVIGFLLKQDGKQVILPDSCYMSGISGDAKKIVTGKTTKADLERILGSNSTKQDSILMSGKTEIIYRYTLNQNRYVLIDSKEEGNIAEDSRDFIVRFIIGAEDGIVHTIVVTDLFYEVALK